MAVCNVNKGAVRNNFSLWRHKVNEHAEPWRQRSVDLLVKGEVT